MHRPAVRQSSLHSRFSSTTSYFTTDSSKYQSIPLLFTYHHGHSGWISRWELSWGRPRGLLWRMGASPWGASPPFCARRCTHWAPHFSQLFPSVCDQDIQHFKEPSLPNLAHCMCNPNHRASLTSPCPIYLLFREGDEKLCTSLATPSSCCLFISTLIEQLNQLCRVCWQR